MKNVLLVLGLFTASIVGAQQTDTIYPVCGTIIDDAGVIKHPGIVETAAGRLIDQGADVRVITVKKVTSNLASVEAWYETNCKWTINGVRKPNLFVVMVAPTDRLKNVFFGSAYSKAMENEDIVNTIYSQAANPFFRGGDFSGGIASALVDFSAKVAAYHDQAKHPIVAQVTNQATDLKPVAGVFKVGLALLVFGGLVIFFIWLLTSRKRQQARALAMQQEAIQAQQTASRLFITLDKDKQGYDDIASLYLQIANSQVSDPNQEGLSAELYEAIRDQWNAASNTMAAFKNETTIHSARPTDTAAVSTEVSAEVSTEKPRAAAAGAGASGSTGTSDDNFLRGAVTGVIGDELLRPRPEYGEPTPVFEPEKAPYDPEPSYTPDPEPDRGSSGSDSSWSSSSDSGSSGSDSSWSDSSSSSSDSGGSGSDSGF